MKGACLEMNVKKIHSIQFSLLLVILPIIAVSLIILSILGYLNSKRIIQSSAEKEMTQSLTIASEYIEKSLSNNSMVAEALARGVESIYQKIDTPEEIAQASQSEQIYEMLLTSFVEGNAETFGGGIWFEPYAYRPDIPYFPHIV